MVRMMNPLNPRADRTVDRSSGPIPPARQSHRKRFLCKMTAAEEPMAVATLVARQTVFGPESNGILMMPQEFDRADFDEDWRFELINGVLIVSPLPLVNESDPNEELGYLLRRYKEDHPLGHSLDATFQERIVRTGKNRRRADRIIWAGLGRLPRRRETPTIIAEFVSGRKRARKRDYQTKRLEYAKAGVKEYWIFDRFTRKMTIFYRQDGKNRKRVCEAHQVFTTDLLPGFELPVQRLFALADRWPADQPE
jgi:Uma2 family endonuclease